MSELVVLLDATVNGEHFPLLITERGDRIAWINSEGNFRCVDKLKMMEALSLEDKIDLEPSNKACEC